MSTKAVYWALHRAPVSDPMLKLVLVAMAEVAHPDGTESRQSMATVAEQIQLSVRTVQRCTRILEDRGIILRGDQSATKHLRQNRRPVVYDLQIHRCRGDNLSPLDVGTKESRGDTRCKLGVLCPTNHPFFLRKNPSLKKVLSADAPRPWMRANSPTGIFGPSQRKTAPRCNQ